MRKEAIILLAFFILIGFASASLNVTPQFPNIKNFNFVYFTPTDAEATFISQHLDLIVYTGAYKPQFRASNPDLQVWVYNTCASRIIDATFTTIWNACLQNYTVIQCENIFFHLMKDANVPAQSNKGGPLFLLRDGIQLMIRMETE